MDTYNRESDTSVNGWYYDEQMNSVLSSVSLHANCSWTGNGWEEYWNGEIDKDGYGKDALFRAILNEDFQVGVTNSWSQHGGDILGGIWSSIMPVAAPYAAKIGDTLQKLEDVQSTRDDSGTGLGASAVNGLKKTISWTNNIVDKLETKLGGEKVVRKRADAEAHGSTYSLAGDYMRRNLVVQGTRFVYYSGTEVGFGNLGMKFTIFPKIDGKGFETVTEQLEKLWPYLIGEWKPVTEASVIINDPNIKEFTKDFASWEIPPGNYTPDYQNVDKIQKGTLKLQFGAHYSIANLLCENASFNFSKQMVKNPTVTSGGEKLLSPLYCDVSLIFKPATRFSEASLKKFISGRTIKVDSAEVLSNAGKEVYNRLDKTKSNLINEYTTFGEENVGSALNRITKKFL